MINTIVTGIIAFIALTGAYLGVENTKDQKLGAFGDTFLSIQLADDPDNGKVLTTDGTDNVWSPSSSIALPFAWTPDTTFGENANSTSTPIWFKDTVYATSTSFFSDVATFFADILPGNSSVDIGATDNRIDNIYANNLDATNLVVGGTVTGDLDMGGFQITNAGQITGTHFTATSTTATSTLPNIDVTQILISDDYITDFAGTGLSVTAGVLNAEVQSSDLHDAVTLSGTPDYITLSGQDIIRGTIDIGDDTNLTCGTNCTLTGDEISVDDAFLLNTGDTASGDYNFSSGTLFIDDSEGNVGIGTDIPSSSLVVANGTIDTPVIADNKNTIALYGNNAAYFKGRDVTNNIEFIMGTSLLGETFVGSMSNHPLSLRTKNIKAIVIDTDQNVGIGDTSPASMLTVGSGDLFQVASDGSIDAITGLAGATGVYDFGGATSFELPQNTTVDANGEITTDDTSGQLRYFAGSQERVITPIKSFAIPYATTTSWTGTTTLPIISAPYGFTVYEAICRTDVGTLDVIIGDGTNDANVIVGASTTPGIYEITTNGTFTKAEDLVVEYGNPASSPTEISCTFNSTITAD